MTNRIREYVEKLSHGELLDIVKSWEAFDDAGVTPMDSPVRRHAIKALPEMGSSRNIVARMRDLAFEVFRNLYFMPKKSVSTQNMHHEESGGGCFFLPAGRYWIGDPCYVQPLEDRNIYLELSDEKEGKYTINGVTFGVLSTKHGDGSFPYKLAEHSKTKILHHSGGNKEVSVDSGEIGIFPYESVDTLRLVTFEDDGIIAEFETDFMCGVYSNGDLDFGGVIVMTDPKEDGSDVENL